MNSKPPRKPTTIIGRDVEWAELLRLHGSARPELAFVLGRRRSSPLLRTSRPARRRTRKIVRNPAGETEKTRRIFSFRILFSRFLEIASFSHASVLNVSDVARDAHIARPVAESYFSILEDLLIGVRLPVFSKRTKRQLITHGKFFYFDAGVYRAIRPTGPLDSPAEIDGPALETLVLQELRAVNDYRALGCFAGKSRRCLPDPGWWQTKSKNSLRF